MIDIAMKLRSPDDLFDAFDPSPLERRRLNDAAASYLLATLKAAPANEETDQWIAWIEAYLASRDPLQSPPGLPDVPEPGPEDLKPFLGGLSPYGPSRW